MTPILGIDISIYQWRTGIPVRMLAKLKSKGIRFIICRASIGTTHDPAVQTSVARIREAGLHVGMYHFLTDEGSGNAQADAFITQVRRAGGPKGIQLVLDFEASATNHPSWQQAKDLADRVAAVLGKAVPMTLYSSRSNAVRVNNPDATGRFDALWQALYTDREDLDTPGVSLPDQAPRAGFFGFTTARMWQYGPCRITAPSGSQVALDGNAWYGTMAELEALAAPRSVPLEQRPGYAVGYNAALMEAQTAVGGIAPSDAGSTVVAKAGFDAAKGDAVEALTDLRMAP